MAGTDLGGIAGGGAGLLTGPGAIVASPAGAITGMAAGGAMGAAAGEMMDQVFFSKGGRGDEGTAFRGGKQSQRDPDHARLMKEFNPSREQRTRIHEEIAKQKKGSDLDYGDLRQIFTDIVGKPK
ncbi:hypothetical protein BH11GEM2_BH11GEM2_05770 [soil metagenome]